MKPVDAMVRFYSKSYGRKIINDTIRTAAPVAKELAKAAAPLVVPVVIVGGTTWLAAKAVKKFLG